MALTTCRECGKEVSTEAPVCPNCGARNPAGAAPTPAAEASPGVATAHRGARVGTVIAVVVALIAVVVVVWAFGLFHLR